MADADRSIKHLLRRAGFGASLVDLATYSSLSYSQAVDRLLNYTSIPDTVDSHIGQSGYIGTTSRGQFSPNTNADDARQRWLFRMIHSERPLQEKMTLFWHNYFATGFTKVAGKVHGENATRLMAAKASEDALGQKGQIELLRDNAFGSLRDLLYLVAQDPAMLIWLDGDSNTKNKPQENFGRELMELFTRGVGYYTEDDVYAAAKVFTGWNLNYPENPEDRSDSFAFIYRAAQHDTTAKTFSFPIYGDGSKTIPARSASSGMQDGIDLINALAAHPETARRLATRLYTFFVSETVTPEPAVIDELATVYLQSGTVIKPVLQRLFESRQFQDEAFYFTRYSWPAEFVVRAIKEVGWAGFTAYSALSPMVNMGQQLLDPPDVAGWTLGQGWFSTSAMLARMNFAATLTENQKYNIARAVVGWRGSASDLLATVVSYLAPTVDSAIYSDLTSYMNHGGAWTGSDTQLQTRVPGLVHLLLGTADYQFV